MALARSPGLLLGDRLDLPGVGVEQLLEHVPEVLSPLHAHVVREALHRSRPHARHVAGIPSEDLAEILVGDAPAQREIEDLAITGIEARESGGELLTIDHPDEGRQRGMR